MKKTFTAYEIKRFGAYSNYVMESFIDRDIESVSHGNGFMDEPKTLTKINKIWECIHAVDFDIRDVDEVTIEMPTEYADFISRKVWWVENNMDKMRYYIN